MDISTSILSDITIYMKYAKFRKDLNRRETWEELVTRNKEMHQRKYPHIADEIEDVYKFVYEKKVLPSMRSLQFGGKPIEIAPNRVYNCAYLPIDDWRAFNEIMFLLLGGTGVGYSVQKHHVEQLPEIRKPNPSKHRRYLVGDSIEGWADAIKHLMKSYFDVSGKNTSTPIFDYSDIRPKGADLVTSGGKAPGPQPLKDCIHNIKEILESKNDTDKLSPIEVHDIVCYIADAVLAGGIRRAALISLFSMDDELMVRSKSLQDVEVISVETKNEFGKEFIVVDKLYGKRHSLFLSNEEAEKLNETGQVQWYNLYPQRGRANNSATILRHKITKNKFFDLWEKIEASRSGEPGVYFTNDKDWGTNPCCEIALRPYQFCNLTEVNASNIVSQEDLNARVRAAAFIGTLQAGYTDFHYLRDIWRKTTEKDALIGVGMTGIGSGAVLKYNLEEAAEVVKDENARVAAKIGINPAARTTTVKPSGTSSLVLGTSSGIHAWHNDFYIRRIRVGKNEAIYQYLAANHPELVEDEIYRPKDQAVISVPQKAPDGSILRFESPFELLDRVKKFNTEWVRAGHRDGQNTHNVSVTVSIKDNEWEAVGNWMWDNRKTFNGISVLPYDGGTYQQAPFEDCSEETYNEMLKSLTSIDLKRVVEYSDNTNLTGELACSSGQCEIDVDMSTLKTK